MNTPIILLVSGVVGCIASAITTYGIVWRDGKSRGIVTAAIGTLGKDIEKGIGALTAEVHGIRETQEDHIGQIGQFMARFEGLEGRVGRVERWVDGQRRSP